MKRYSVREVVEQAVRTEQQGYEFYRSMAERFREEEKLKNLFNTLAEKELAHEKRFRELYEVIGDEEPGDWDIISEYMRAMVESEFFLGSGKSLASLKEIQSSKEAVEFAISFEKETLLYFIGIRSAVDEKEVVDEIINEEQSHIMWLNRFKERFL
jgi:rubrerythrin